LRTIVVVNDLSGGIMPLEKAWGSCFGFSRTRRFFREKVFNPAGIFEAA